MKTVAVSYNARGKYFASILFEYEEEITMKYPESFIGLDYSMHELSNENQARRNMSFVQ